ncbi:hypothetical protein CGLO_07108 [Colletotrichum gloeosporioides Cg-14]|uniref:Uncharacterized protein n=1 Tax=Colletotrichum gloeosporioides (strain Cg-14) TaxID=1237896 RepID=T0KMI8_COLGC|nr:hypothetical protein CGLO_07108 [Colletotrichum gloeosporioides Cg-14]
MSCHGLWVDPNLAGTTTFHS